MPPTAGLQDICAIRSRFMVIIAVRSPMRAQARAASQPACPAPTTTTSYFEDFMTLPFLSGTGIRACVSFRGEVKILVIGSGGREHALCWKLAQSPKTTALYAAPGNPGIAQVATCLATADYLAAAESIDADLTVVGPEAPLAAGIVDRFREKGRRIVGPTAAAARLEASKAFAKEFMLRAGIATARFAPVDSAEQARASLRAFDFPVVLKADGLAAGKGAIIVNSAAEAVQSIAQLLTPGSTLVIEEFLTGEEVSFMALSDGVNILLLEPTQDHKAVHDGDSGPNTGGRGAYCDSRVLGGFH